MKQHRVYKMKKRSFGYVPTNNDAITLPPGKKLIQSPVINADASVYKNKGLTVHVNAGSCTETFPIFGADNCAVLVEVGFLITWGNHIGKVIDNWSDADFKGCAEFIVSQVGCSVVSSSFNEGYAEAAPYALDMNAKPVASYKLMNELSIALNARGWRYLGEYSGSIYPLSENPAMENPDQYRTLVTNDQAAYNSLKGTPNPGTPNLHWLGDVTFTTDLHTKKDILIDVYFEPGGSYHSAKAWFFACCLSIIIVRNALRFLNNTTSRICTYGYLQSAQEYNTQFFYYPMPSDIGGFYMGTKFIGYDLGVQFDGSLLFYILADWQQWWAESTNLYGSNPRVLQPDYRRDDGVYLREYLATGGGTHDPGIRRPTNYERSTDPSDVTSKPFDGNEPKGFLEFPMPAHDLPKEASDALHQMYVLAGSTTPAWFPVRVAGATAWGKSTPESLIDAFKNGEAFAVGYSNGVDSCAYILMSFADNIQNYEVLGTGNTIQAERAARLTGVIGFSKA